MAYNWTLKEMYEKYEKGDATCIADAGKRFPFAAKVLTQLIGNPGAKELFSVMPDNFTASKLNGYLKDSAGITLNNDDDNSEESRATEAKAASNPENNKSEKKAGRGRPKKEGKEAVKPEKNPYSGMTDIELYKQCVIRGIECEKRKKPNYYIGLLNDDDAKKNVADGDEWAEDVADGDEWAEDVADGDEWKV